MRALRNDCAMHIFTYYAGIMPDAFSTYYAQNYAGIIGAGLKPTCTYIFVDAAILRKINNTL